MPDDTEPIPFPRPKSFRRRSKELPMYTDESKQWHWHVRCKACHPDDCGYPGMVVLTRSEGVVLRDDANAGIHGNSAGHRHILYGCGGLACRPVETSPA